MPAMLWQHDPSQPIGIWTEMVEDEQGPAHQGPAGPGDHAGKEAHALLKMGALNGLSIGFMSKQWAVRPRDGRAHADRDRSLGSVPGDLPRQRKSAHDERQGLAGRRPATPKDAERILREAGFSKADATGLVSRLMRMGDERRESAQSTAQAMNAADRLLRSLTS
jgi:hypothetical protein